MAFLALLPIGGGAPALQMHPAEALLEPIPLGRDEVMVANHQIARKVCSSTEELEEGKLRSSSRSRLRAANPWQPNKPHPFLQGPTALIPNSRPSGGGNPDGKAQG